MSPNRDEDKQVLTYIEVVFSMEPGQKYMNTLDGIELVVHVI